MRINSLTTSQGNNAFLLLPTLPTIYEMLCIDITSIIRIEASSNYSKIFCRGRRFPIVASKVLRWFEEKLPQQLFTRVHRTHLINKSYVASIQKNNVLLACGMKISISRRKRRNFLANFS